MLLYIVLLPTSGGSMRVMQSYVLYIIFLSLNSCTISEQTPGVDQEELFVSESNNLAKAEYPIVSDHGLEHQVYAFYRRQKLHAEAKVISNTERFDESIQIAAELTDFDPLFLNGMIANECSGRPRVSPGGGHGLMQIRGTPPACARSRAAAALEVDEAELDWRGDDTHNVVIGAFTLECYTELMDGDILLGMLAYNMGPANKSLEKIIDTYGATTFLEVQPYLKDGPATYPIRVYGHALAFQIHATDGDLPEYQNNAELVQSFQIPGWPK